MANSVEFPKCLLPLNHLSSEFRGVAILCFTPTGAQSIEQKRRFISRKHRQEGPKKNCAEPAFARDLFDSFSARQHRFAFGQRCRKVLFHREPAPLVSFKNDSLKIDFVTAARVGELTID